uniref:ATP-dependent RNA helicase n=1 Tax=Theileria annulata TaxID=5874 RepID=A0A3B0N5M4_THEAN
MESDNTDSAEVELTSHKFDDLDINDKTKKVLKSKGYVYLTKVQSKVLPLALSGKNLVIQSPTGSGKTLCFLLPAVKHLFDEGYSGNLPIDANLLGCICLAPTRELASQIALQMKDLADPLKLNSGCCIGGVRDKYDKKNANRLHILTGTPGRILALLSSQSLPETHNIKILIMDEADRLIDVGFRDDIISIVDFLPNDLQFLFFSATIKSSLKELCDILLKNVSYELVCLGSDSDGISESNLRQELVLMSPKLKLSALFYILSNNQNKRIIVFLSTCKLVRFSYEVFKRLIPAVPMTELHGKQSQNKRLTQFTRFAAKQNHGCIFTTDIAARGIDFPAVDIVVQFDLPDSLTTYTHRVGRSGRLSVEGFRNYGRTIMLISDHESDFIKLLKTHSANNNVKGHTVVHDVSKLMVPLIEKREGYVTRKLQAILAKESWIKEMAQRALVAHLRYVTTRSLLRPNNNQIIEEINQLSISMGLPYSPNIQLTNGNSNDTEVPTGKKSKLSKLKNKIKQKNLKNVIDTEELDQKKEPDEQVDDVLYLSKSCVNDDIDLYTKSAKDPEREVKKQLASSRNKLRLNRRGIAKIRGVVTLKEAEQNHVIFSDDEAEDEAGDKSEYISKLQSEISKNDQFDKVNYNQIKREAKKAKHS